MSRAPALAAAAAALGCLATLPASDPVLLWNLTPSAPTGPYLVAPAVRPRAGDLAAVALPEPVRGWAVARGYVGPRTLLLKRVAAAGGQTVCRIGPRVTVDGRLAAMARPIDRAGRALPAWSGCMRLGPRQVLLLNDRPDSLDGRYLGPTPLEQVKGRAVRAPWPG